MEQYFCGFGCKIATGGVKPPPPPPILVLLNINKNDILIKYNVK